MDAHTGGYLAGFERSGFKFDSSIHWLNQCGPDGSVTKVLKWIGDDYPRCRELKNIRRFVTDKHSFVLTNDPDELKAELIKTFPDEEKGLIRFFRDAKKMAEVLGDYSSRVKGVSHGSFLKKINSVLATMKFGMFFVQFVRFTGEKGVLKGLKKYFKDPELLDLWSVEIDLLSCLIPIAWAYNKDYQCAPVGGAETITKWLEEKCRENGCDIFLSTKVEKINNNGILASGVTAFKNGEKLNFTSDIVIAASDVESFYERLLDPGLTSPDLLQKLKSAELYSSAVTLSIGLDCEAETLGFTEEMTVLVDSSVSREDSSCGSAESSCITVFSPTVRDTSMAPDGKGTLIIFVPAFFDHFEKWGTEIGDSGELVRGEKYKKIKKEFADILLERVKKSLHKDIRSHIEHLDIATPVTYFRYTGNRKGSMMGARPGKNNFKAKIAHHITPLKNVYLSGHWSALGGGVPIAVSTALSSFLLVAKEDMTETYEELSKYLIS
jgi:prolycopene isomerase